MGSSAKEQITSQVKRRVEELQRRSFADLEALPEFDTQTVQVANAIVTMTVYRTRRPDGHLLVVVQACRERLFGIYHNVFAEGFVASANGTRSEATEELLWDYT